MKKLLSIVALALALTAKANATETTLMLNGTTNPVPQSMYFSMGQHSQRVTIKVSNNSTANMTPSVTLGFNQLNATIFRNNCSTLRPSQSCALILDIPAPRLGSMLSGEAVTVTDTVSGVSSSQLYNLFGTPAVCPRNPIGGELQDSVHLFSQNGVLESDYYVVTNVDGNGNQMNMPDTGMPYYCMLTKYGEPSPIPHVKPGDNFIAHFHNLMPVSMDQVTSVGNYQSALGYFQDYANTAINGIVNFYNSMSADAQEYLGLSMPTLPNAQNGEFVWLLPTNAKTQSGALEGALGTPNGVIDALLYGAPFTGTHQVERCPGTTWDLAGTDYHQPGGYYPSTINMHFHGINTTPTCGGDQITYIMFSAGESYTYNYIVPSQDPPGIYAFHPHVHTLANDHMNGGFTGMYIVDGIENFNSDVLGLPTRHFFFRDQVYQDSGNYINGTCTNPSSCPDASQAPTWNTSVNFHPIPYDLNSSVYDYSADLARINAQGNATLYVPTAAAKPDGFAGFSYTAPVAYGNTASGSPITKADHYPTPFIKMKASIPGRHVRQEFWRIANFGGDNMLDIEVRVNGVPQPLKIVEMDGVPANSNDAGQFASTLTTLPNGAPIMHYLLPTGNRVGIIVDAPAVAAGGVAPKMMLFSRAYNSNGDQHTEKPLVNVLLDQSFPKAAMQIPSRPVLNQWDLLHQFQGLWAAQQAALGPAVTQGCSLDQASQSTCQANPNCSWVASIDGQGQCLPKGQNHTVFFGETNANNPLTGGNPDFWEGVDNEAVGRGNPVTQLTVSSGTSFDPSGAPNATGVFYVNTFTPAQAPGFLTTNLVFTPDITKLPVAAASKQGTVEEWVVENHASETHLFHMHQVHFLLEAAENFNSANEGNVNSVYGGDDTQVLTGQVIDTMAIPGWDESITGCEPLDISGVCSNTAYTTGATCGANGGTWTPNTPADWTAFQSQNGDSCRWDFAHQHIPKGYAYPRIKVKLDFRGGDGVAGLTTFHCHVLGHEDYGMIRLFVILP